MSVSITGISGPGGGSKEKPIGLYYISVCYNDLHVTKNFNFNIDDREMHREVVATTALNMIRLTLMGHYDS